MNLSLSHQSTRLCRCKTDISTHLTAGQLCEAGSLLAVIQSPTQAHTATVHLHVATSDEDKKSVLPLRWSFLLLSMLERNISSIIFDDDEVALHIDRGL